MSSSPSTPKHRRAPTADPTRAPARSWPGALTAVAMVVSLLAMACGGGGTSQNPAAASGNADAGASAAPGIAVASRTGAGISAAKGDLAALSGTNACVGADGEPVSDTVKVAYLGADLAELAAVGLETLVIEEPGRMVSAYVDEVNANGGIGGQCVEFINYLWSLAEPEASFAEICSDLPTQQPIFVLALRGDGTDCIVAAAVPTIGLFSSAPEATVGQAGGRYYLDDGTNEFLLAASLEVARASGIVGASDGIGLLLAASGDVEAELAATSELIDDQGLQLAASASVPAAFGDLAALLLEKQVGLLASNLSDEEQALADQALAALPPEVAGAFEQIELFYLDTATRFRDAGVTAVGVSAGWSEVRRLMRAAERIGWHPQWITNDIQPATLTLTEAPEAQADNFYVVSARRAAGDAIPELDRSCITLRNSSSEVETFSHRHHTDAWSLIMATCDYLDVAFSAMSRVDGPLTQESFVQALSQTEYSTPYGARITFTSDNYSGSDRFRVLQADPGCVLNEWGCMRSVTDWIMPSAGAEGESG